MKDSRVLNEDQNYGSHQILKDHNDAASFRRKEHNKGIEKERKKIRMPYAERAKLEGVITRFHLLFTILKNVNESQSIVQKCYK